MEYKAEIRMIQEHIVYYKEYVIRDMNDFFDRLSKRNFLQELSDQVFLENPDINLTEPDYNVILFVDGEFKEQNVRVEFCDAVTGYGMDTGEYKFKRVPSFTSMTVLHKGPYKRLVEAYSYAYQWMDKNGYKKVGCPRNSAINGFWNQDKEEDYLTEIQIPIKKIINKEKEIVK